MEGLDADNPLVCDVLTSSGDIEACRKWELHRIRATWGLHWLHFWAIESYFLFRLITSFDWDKCCKTAIAVYARDHDLAVPTGVYFVPCTLYL